MSYRSTGINPKTNPLDGSRSRPTNRSEYKDLPQQNEGDGGVPPPPRARSASRLNANSSNLREKHEDMKTRSPPPPPRSGAPTVNADYSPKSGESQYVDHIRISVSLEECSSVLLVYYVMWSGASESLDLLLSHSAITLAYHKHHTHIYPLFDTKN